MFAESVANRPRKSHRVAREVAILSAALRMFAGRGYDGARIEDIADAAGIGKGTLYVYFASKQAVLEGVVRAAAEPSLAAIDAISAAAGGDPVEALRAVIARAKAALRDEIAPVFLKVLVAEGGRAPEIGAIYARAVLDPLLAVVAEIVARGVASGAFRPIDPMLAARLLIAPAVSAAIARDVLGGDAAAFDPDALLDAHADLFLAGLQTR